MSETFEIKLWEGWRILHNGEVTECDSPVKVWEYLGLDIESDPEAKKFATEITRAMYCFGYVDLTPALKKRGHLILEVIPCKDEEDTGND